ncbi:arsenite methyltransferase-like [Dysidea avara]|uniref:arsenite methyltransferase-like n=1 Tax=Dysidea avara TaxID=196820 RepID=UPI003322B9E0
MADSSEKTHEQVQEYYGQRVKSTDQLLTTACTVISGEGSGKVKAAIKNVHPDVLSKYYGCGLVFPEQVEDCRILDLGSGAGRDCFVLSQLVGANGHVTGVDMTQEQLDVANKHIQYHTEKFGYSKSNVDFKKGFIENLSDAGISDSSYDIVISNCVVNLAHDKLSVLKGAYNALKDGGELYFSDVYVDRPVPDELRKNSVLWGECISGALYWKDLVMIAAEVGFAPPVVVSATAISTCGKGAEALLDAVKSDPSISSNPELLKLLGQLSVASVTYRLFKVPKTALTSDSPVQVTYKGTIDGHAEEFKLSYDLSLQKSIPVVLPQSVAEMFTSGRLKQHFDISPTSAESPSTSYKNLDQFNRVNPFEVISTPAPSTGSCCQGSSCCS